MAEEQRTFTTAAALPRERGVLVIGAGTMGSGIAEVAAAAGHPVYLRDGSDAAVERGLGLIRASLERRVAKGRLDAAERDAILARVMPAPPELPAGLGLVIEAIYEDLQAKVDAFEAVEAMLPADAILATNTSSLSVTALAGRLARPGRVVGMHFFNPAPALPLVEVVSGHATDPAVADTVAATAQAWGKTPVRCRSTPGFIVNRVARPFYGEALRLLQEQACTPAALDAVLRESGGFRMGPCELTDLIGQDVNLAVTRSVYAAFDGDPRYRPSLVQRELVDAGWLGRKSGRGFFDYGPDAFRVQPDDAGAGLPAPRTVHLEGDLGAAQGLAALLSGLEGVTVTSTPSLDAQAGRGVLRVDGHVLALTDGRTAAARARELGEPVVLFDLALDYARCTRVAVAASDADDERGLRAALGLFAALGKPASVLADLPGLAVMRTVAMLVNEGAEAVFHGISDEAGVDVAMRLGVNYPVGPLAWGRTIGLPSVLRVLENLRAAYGEDRYRASVWLRREVDRQAVRQGA
ncbi:3-hydroxyacyl-CoA dehydrogenase [Comamonadaceae bacterium PP-2]